MLDELSYLNDLAGLEAYGLTMPAVMEDNRFEFGEGAARPRLAGALSYGRGDGLLQAAAWAAGAYMAPYPVAAVVAYQVAAPRLMQRSRRWAR